MFRGDFSVELADRYDYYIACEEYDVFVCEEGGKIVGFEVLKNVSLLPTPFSVERNYLLIEEIGIDEHFRRGGVGTKLIDFAKDFAQGSICIEYSWMYLTMAQKFLPETRF